MKMIPVSTPLIDESDVLAVCQVLRDGWISGEGPVVAEFETDFASSCNRKYGISVVNGTAALDLLIHALGFGSGDEIIVPSFSIISCISQILRCGATPVFIDADPQTWNMDVAQVETAITKKTKAILAVHTYGLPVDMNSLLEVASRHNLLVLEDAAEAHGLRFAEQRCGSFGFASTFSFYANKNITCGEGGIILTDDENLAKRLRDLRNLAFRTTERFVHDELGWNLRLSSLQCALAQSQLRRIDKIINKRRFIGNFYQEAFKGIQGVQLPISKTTYSENDYWVFGVVLDDENRSRREVVESLSSLGIGTRPFFWPLHQQPVLSLFGLDHQPSLPTSEKIGRQGFYIPNGLGMTQSELEYVVEHVTKVLV
jgi:perosamine synthetase